MYNKKPLREAIKNLDRTKAPAKKKDMIVDPMGQWKYPGQNTRIPGNDITMQGVPYPVWAVPNVGTPQMMYPEQDYYFPGADHVDEYPQMQKGGKTQKYNEYNQDVRYKKLYEPVVEKITNSDLIMNNWEKYPNYNTSWMEYILSGPSKDRNMPPETPLLKEVQQKILALPSSEIDKLLKVNWSGAGLPTIMYNRPSNVSVKDMWKYYNHLNYLKNQGYTLEEGGDISIPQLNQYEDGGEYDLTQDEIDDLIAQGYEVEDVDTDEYKKGGTLKLPNKKNSWLYSRSLSARNKLFLPNNLTASRKWRIFDPQAKYLQDGGPADTIIYPPGDSEYMNQPSYNYDIIEMLNQKARRDYEEYMHDQTDPTNINRTSPAYQQKFQMKEGLRQAQDGGPYNTTGPTQVDQEQEYDPDAMNAMMKARFAYAQMHGNPAAQRMVNAPDQPYVYTGQEYDRDFNMPVGVPEGAIGTHYMASFGNYAVPFIQQGPRGLYFNELPTYKDREAIRFENEGEAGYFGGHYKEIAPDASYREYAKGGFQDDIKRRRKLLRDWTYGASIGMLHKAQLGLIKSPYQMPAGTKHPMQVVKQQAPKNVRRQYNALEDVKPQVSESTKPKQTFKPDVNLKDAAQIKKDELNLASYLVSQDPLLSEKQKADIMMDTKKLEDNIYRIYTENPSSIKQVAPQSKSSRVWEYVTNPFTALEYEISGGGAENMPRGINKMRAAGIDPGVVQGRNVVGNTLNEFYNLADAADKTARYAGQGDYLNAGSEALRFLPGARVSTGLGKQTSKYLTQGPLRNAYTINPLAGRLGKYNRVVGQDAIDDIVESGLVRVNENAGVANDLGPFGIVNRTTPYPSFGKAKPQQVYADQVIDQGKTPYIISTDRPMKPSTLGRHGKGKTQFPVDDAGKYMTGFPASEAKVFEFGDPHWLRGYKELPIELPGSPNQYVRSGLGGMDMSRYEIKNPDYFTQLLNTYDSKALSASNKKFYKDLIASVKKQNGLITERQYNELQRLKTGNFNFGKKAYQEGGEAEYEDLDLTPAEIDWYLANGYEIEDLGEVE